MIREYYVVYEQVNPQGHVVKSRRYAPAACPLGAINYVLMVCAQEYADLGHVIRICDVLEVYNHI